MGETIRIGILNCETGKEVAKKEMVKPLFRNNDEEFFKQAMKEAKKVSQWFDQRDTFFGIPVWEHWEKIGILGKFEAVVRGSRLGNLAVESIAVFNKEGNRGVEHEFFIERVAKEVR